MWTRLYQDQGKGAERGRQAVSQAREETRISWGGGDDGNTRAHRAWAEARTHVDVRRGGYTWGCVGSVLEAGEGK